MTEQTTSAKTVGDLSRAEGAARYDWVDYDADARATLRASLDAALSSGYFRLRDDDPSDVAEDVGEYDPTFEGVDPHDLVGWIEEWQRDMRRRESNDQARR